MFKKVRVMVGMSKAKAEPKSLPKRFYKDVAFDAAGEGYCITLDGKPVRTPGRHLLQVKDAILAAAIAAEWEAQKVVIDPEHMPLTRLAHITIDRVQADRTLLLEDIARYAETDLLCYRAPWEEAAHGFQGDSVGLRAHQDVVFDPVLQWVEQKFAASFVVTEGLMPVAQPKQSLEAIAAVYAATNDAELAALAMMVPLLGSVFLSLAIWKGFRDVESVLIAARLDETMQAEKWGSDPEVEASWSLKAKDIRACAFFLTHN